MRDWHLDTGRKNVGESPGEESGERAVKRMREWKPIDLLCVALGLNLACAKQPFTTELESQHLFLFTFYFKTKLPRRALNSLCIHPRQVLLTSVPRGAGITGLCHQA